MHLLRFTTLVLILTTGCAVAENKSVVFGVSNIEAIGEHYKINKIGHSSASRVEIYDVRISELEDKKCLFKDTLTSMTFTFNEKKVLINSERIHKGNLLSEIQACLSKEYMVKEFTSDERQFFGPEAAKFETSTTEVVVFYTGSENTTRYGISLKSESKSR